MSSWLLAVGILTAIVWSVRSTSSSSKHGLLRVYVVVSSLLLAVVVVLSERSLLVGGLEQTAGQRRIQHLGYYLAVQSGTGDSATFRFAGEKSTGPHFFHPSLGPKDELNLTATIDAARIQKWIVQWNSASKPVRINDFAVNVPEQMWLQSGDVIRICLKGSNTGTDNCIELKFTRTRDPVRFWKRLQTFALTVPGKSPLQVSRTITYGIRLSDFVRRNDSWVAALMQLGDQRWFDIIDSVVLVRQQGGNSESSLGVLIGPDVSLQDAKVFKNESVAAPATFGGKEIVQEDTVSYGIGLVDALQVRLGLDPVIDFVVGATSGRKSDLMESRVVPLHFVRPVTWPIPPLDLTKEIPTQRFVFTSGESYIPLNGYSFQLPDRVGPFYATGYWSTDLRTLHLSRPYDRLDVLANDPSPFLMGRMSDGVLLSITEAHMKGSRWVVPIVIFLSGALFAWLAVPASGNSEILAPRFAVLWVLGTTLLTVRYLVAYRISALPPLGLSPSDQEMFSSAATHAAEGFLYPMLMTLVIVFMGFLDRPPRWYRTVRQGPPVDQPPPPSSGPGIVEVLLNEPRPQPVRKAGPRSKLNYAILLLPAFVVLLGWAFGKRQALFLGGFGLRINIATFLAIVMAIILFVRRHGMESLTSRVAVAWSIWLAMGLQALPGLIGDRGTFIVYFPCILATVMLIALDYVPTSPPALRAKWRSRTAAVLFSLTPLLVGAALVVHDAPWQKTGDLLRIKPARGTADDLLLDRAAPRLLDLDLVRANLLQQWQMKAFSAAGTNPLGYGKAPLSNAGMSYATALTDCAFGTLILAEHGWISATLVLLLLWAIGWVIAETATHFRTPAAYAVPLLAIGGFFAWNGLYMALANAGPLPFTGQNVPGLSLVSRGDLHEVGFLILAATWLMCREKGLRTHVDEKRRRACILIYLTFGLALCALVYFSIVAGYSLRQERGDLQADFNIISNARQKAEFDAIARNLPDESNSVESLRNWEFVPGSDNLRRTKIANPSSLEETLVDQYNRRADKRDGRRGLLVLVGEQSRAVELKREHYVVASPFHQELHLWPGSIVSHFSAGLPTICGFTTPQSATEAVRMSNCFGFSLTGQGRSIDCFAGQGGNSREESPPPPAVIGGFQSRDYTCSGGGENLFQLRRNGENIEVRTYRAMRAYVDGEPLPLNAPRTLKPYSIFSVRYQSEDKHLIYIGQQQIPVAYVTWRNGTTKRLFPLGKEFPSAYALGKIADQIADRLRAEHRDQIVITVDLELQRQLQDYMANYAQQMEPYNDPRQAKRLAVTVLDAFSGAVRALPQWPIYDPSATDFDETLQKANTVRAEYMVRNANLLNHVVGSTMKPLVFSSLAAEFHDTLNLGKLEFSNTTNRSGGLKGIHPHTIVGGIPLDGSWDCNSTTERIGPEGLLVKSLDFYEGALGILGSLLSPTDAFGTPKSPGVFRPSQQGNLWYDQKSYMWDMTALRNTERESAWTLGSGTKRYDFKVTAMRDVLLMKGLRDVFDLPQEVNDGENAGTPERTIATSSFLRGLPVHDVGAGLSYITPDRVEVKPFRSAYPDLILCVLGGGDACRFNNVWMAQSAARIATATKVTASLIESPELSFDPLPKPLSEEEWRQHFLINFMQEAYLKGTAAELLRPHSRNNLPKGWKPFQLDREYRGIFKTGTLQEGVDADNQPRESEALLFVIGRMKNGKFVRGDTLAGFIYMQDAKRKLIRGDMRKFGFAPGILNLVLAHLRSTNALGN
jgi:hypothetical protein